MATPPEPIARIRLARSLPRLLGVPLVLLVAGAAAIAGGLLAVGGALGIALAVLGGPVAAGGLALASVLLTVRFEVEETAVGVSWLGGGRTYPLTAGPVTRVRLSGPSASRIRARTGALGWTLGRAVLRGTERIEVVRLAPTASVILIPTERGRLAVAPARDDDLLDALSRAARARARLDALAAGIAAPPEPTAEPEPEAVPEPAPEPEAVPEPEPRPLTGIERAMLERQLAEEREAGLVAATDAAEGPVAEPAVEAEMPAPSIAMEPVTVAAAPLEERAERPARRMALGRPRPALALAVLPLAGALAAWGIGSATGRMPEPGTDLARLTSLALVMAGPAASIGTIMALSWWPRLVGVVVAGGLAASVFIGRALIGA